MEIRELSIDQARRVAIAAQGLAEPRPSRVNVRHFRKVVSHTKVVQLDSVNVAVRAHYMPFFSRLGAYDRVALDRWINSDEMFEYWAHVATVLPTIDLPLMRFRMDEMTRSRRIDAVKNEHPGYVKEVLDEVAEHGPLTVSDLKQPGERTGPWWGHGKGKVALDHLYGQGLLTIRGRTPNFVSIYDLPERVFSAELLADRVPREEAHRQLLVKAADAHGVGTLADLADYYRISNPDARPRLAELVEKGELKQVQVADWSEPAYMLASTRVPKRVIGRALLAPFDPLVWRRDRVERLFNFRYRIEIYVPEPQRQYGYYVYPLLLDGELVGRIDLKAHRKSGVLRAPGVFVEDSVDQERVANEMAAEVRLMADWLGLTDVEVGRKGNLARRLRAAI